MTKTAKTLFVIFTIFAAYSSNVFAGAPGKAHEPETLDVSFSGDEGETFMMFTGDVFLSNTAGQMGTTVDITFTGSDPTGVNGPLFTLNTSSCGPNVYEVDPSQNANVYFTNNGTHTFYPTSATGSTVAAGDFQFTATFDIPMDADWTTYDLYILSNDGCAGEDIVKFDVFGVTGNPTVTTDPVEAVQGETLTVDFTGSGGARFTMSSGTCNSGVYEINTTYNSNVRLEGPTNSIYPGSTTGDFSSSGSTTFSATFNIPGSADLADYDVVIDNFTDLGCVSDPIRETDAFTIGVYNPSFSIDPVSAIPDETLTVNFTGSGGAKFSTLTPCAQGTWRVGEAQANVFLRAPDNGQVFPTSVSGSATAIGSTTFSATFTMVTPTTTGFYDVVIQDEASCAGSDMELTDFFEVVDFDPHVTADITTALAGETVTITFTGTGGAKFTMSSETINNNVNTVFEINPAYNGGDNVQLWDGTTAILPNSVTGSFDVGGSSTFEAEFTFTGTHTPGFYRVEIDEDGSFVNNGISDKIFNLGRYPHINRISPEAAISGKTLLITGKFLNEPGTGVSFDGAAPVTPNMTGSNFLTVTVPTGVGPGPIQVFVMNDNGSSFISNGGGSNFTVLQSDFGGGFQEANNISALGITKMKTNDFNNDGSLDVAVLDTDNGNVVIVEGNGLGGFSLGASIFVGDGKDIETGDFDQNGFPDVIATDANSNNLRVMLLNTDGTSNFTSNVALAGGLRGVDVGDFDRDGLMDAVATSTTTSQINILNNRGFINTYTSLSMAFDVAVGDINEDGFPDLAVVGGAGGGDNILFNVGNGTDDYSAFYNNVGVGNDPSVVMFGDFNGDNNLDAVTANTGSNDITFLPGEGDGGIGFSRDLNVGLAPNDLAKGDFNGDGVMDILVSNAGSSSLTLYFGDLTATPATTGGFTSSKTINLPDDPNGIAVGDFDSDGALDIAVSYGPIATGKIGFLENLNTQADFLDVDFTNQFGTSVIDAVNNTVTAQYVFGTDVNDVFIENYTLSPGANISPDPTTQVWTDGASIDFTITAEDGTDETWSVNLTEEASAENDILDITFNEVDSGDPGFSIAIDNNTSAVNIQVPVGTDLTSLTPSVTGSPDASVLVDDGQGGFMDPDGVTLDFSAPDGMLFEVTAENGDIQNWTVFVVVQPSITWSGDFFESVDNDGSIDGSRTASLAGDTFTDFLAGGAAPDQFYTVEGLPPGLDAVITRTSSTEAIITLSGNAEFHTSANDFTLVVTFVDGAFTNSTADQVANNVDNYNISFNDEQSLSYSGSFTEVTANDGSVSGEITITLSGDAFASLATASFTESTHYTITNLPAGMSAVLTRTGNTGASLILAGNATSHEDADDVTDLTITFLDAAFTNFQAADITNSTYAAGEIDFNDAPLLAFAGSFTEVAANDGSVSGSRTITLSGDTFVDPGADTPLTLDTDYTLTGLPDGLTPEMTWNSSTILELTLSGNATDHEATNSVTDFTITLLDPVFTTVSADDIPTSTNNAGSIAFTNAPVITYSGNFAETAANDGSVEGTRTATISGDLFVDASFTEGTHYTLQGVPAGLTASMERSGGGSTATLSFSGNATSHQDTHSVTSLTITFLDAAFQTVAAANIPTSSDANGTITFTDNAGAAPVPPTLSLDGVTNTTATVTWTEVSNATSYELDVSGDDFTTFVSGYGPKSISGTTTETVTGLDSSTPYKARIRAVNNNGTSDDSNVVSFTTNDPGGNSAPTSIELDGTSVVENMPVETVVGTLSTTDPNSEDTHSYSLETNEELFSIISGNTLVTDVSFDEDTRNSYDVTVRSTDQGGLFITAVFNITISPDVVGPTFEFNEFDDEYSGSSIEVIATIEDNAGIQSASIFTKNTTETNYQETTVSESGGAGKYPFTFDRGGVSFYFSAMDNEGNPSSSRIQSIREQATSVDAETFPSPPAIEDFSNNEQIIKAYRIIALPYDGAQVSELFNELQSLEHKKDWRLQRYTGVSTNNGYVDVTLTQSLNAGEGYFFITKDELSISVGGSSVLLDDGVFKVQLREGWNLLGNPFRFNIDWADVIAHNINEGITVAADIENGDMWEYTGTWLEVSVLNEFTGGFIKVDKTGGITNFEFPPDASTGGGGRAANQARVPSFVDIDNSSWKFHFYIAGEILNYSLGAIGMDLRAEDSDDFLDGSSIPHFEYFIDQRFDDGNTRSIKETADFKEWTFTIPAKTSDKTFELKWDYPMSDRNTVILVDEGSGKLYDLSRQTATQVTNNPSTQYQVYFGERDEILNRLDLDVMVFANLYPNPGNNDINVELIAPRDQIINFVMIGLDGRQAFESDVAVNTGLNQLNLDLRSAEIPAGVYQIMINGEGFKPIISKFIKQ